MAQPHSSDLGHEIELGRPCVAKPHGSEGDGVDAQADDAGHDLLSNWIMTAGIQPYSAVVHTDRSNRLSPIEAPQVRNEAFQDEGTVGFQHGGHALEAGHLILLRQQAEEGVEHYIDEAEQTADR